jgi:hypothetical protein
MLDFPREQLHVNETRHLCSAAISLEPVDNVPRADVPRADVPAANVPAANVPAANQMRYNKHYNISTIILNAQQRR